MIMFMVSAGNLFFQCDKCEYVSLDCDNVIHYEECEDFDDEYNF